MKCIINARKAGEPINHLFRIKDNSAHYVDEMVNFTEVIRICYEAGMPFKEKEALRVFKKIYDKEEHGIRKDSWNSLKKYLIPNDSITFSSVKINKTGDSGVLFQEGGELHG
jgi:hypothetical protein